MKKLACWLMILSLLLGCAGGLAETADGNETTSFLQVTGTGPVPVWQEITDTDKTDELQPGQLCGLLDDVTTDAGVRRYQIIYTNQEKKSAVGYIRPEDVRRLNLAELNALMEDPAKANEAMDLLDAVNAYLKPANRIKAAVTGNAEAKGEDSSEDGSFQGFYESAMDSLDQVFNMDVPSAGPDLEGEARDIAGQAMDAGKKFLDTSLDDAKNLIEDVSKDAEEKVADAAPGLEKKLSDALDAAREGFLELTDKAKEKIDELAEQARGGIDQVLEIAGETIVDLGEKAEKEITEAAPVITEELNSLLTDMREKISGMEDVSEDTLGSWVDDINALFEDDAGNAPGYPDDESLTEKLDRLKDHLAGSTDDLTSALQDALTKIEDKGLLEFASQLLHSLSQANPGQWAEILKPENWQGGN